MRGRIDIRPLLQQKLHAVQMSGARCRYEGCELIPIMHIHVHLLLFQEPLHQLLIPVRRGTNEVGAEGAHGLDVGRACKLQLQRGVRGSRRGEQCGGNSDNGSASGAMRTA